MATKSVNTLEELQALSQFSSGLIVINFWASWSNSSIQMSAIFEELSKLYHQNITFVKVEAEVAVSITDKYEVQSVPTFFFLKNGSILTTLYGFNAPELTKRVEALSQQVAPQTSNTKSHKELLFERLKKHCCSRTSNGIY